MITTPANYKTIVENNAAKVHLNFFLEPLDDFYNTNKSVLEDFDIAIAFYSKALQCYHNQDFFIATFMMQQAAKLIYKALIHHTLNERVYNEKLNDLRLMLKQCKPDFKDVFPCDNDNEYNLIQQLEQAGIHPSQTKDLSITEEEVLQLLERVEELIELAKDYFTHLNNNNIKNRD